jgi:hypothetical protein
MRKVQKVKPAKPVKKTLQQVKVTRTLTELVRGNLVALLRDRIAADKVHNAMIDAYEHWMKTGRKIGGYSFTKGILDGVERRDVMRWTPDRLHKSSGIPKAVIRKVFEEPVVVNSTKNKAKKPTGQKLLRVDEVIPLAVFFGVTPGYLFQPFREDLENNSLLCITGFGAQDFLIDAHQWFSWVHGFKSLPYQGSATIEERLTYLSATSNTKLLKPHEMNAPDELQRFLDSTYASEVNATIIANMQFHPLLAPPPIEPHPYDTAIKKRTQVARIRWRLVKEFSFMTNARRALRLATQISNPVHLKQAIDWSVEQMRVDLSSLAANRDDVGLLTLAKEILDKKMRL